MNKRQGNKQVVWWRKERG